MIKYTYNKCLTFIIVALFVGTVVFPCISGYSRNNLSNSDKAISASLDEQIDQIGPTENQTDLNAIDAKIPFGKYVADDTVILAQLIPNKELGYGSFKGDTAMIGDCVWVRRGFDAIQDGYRLGMRF